MIEISEYLWETIYTLKGVYDHDPEAPVLKAYRNTAIEGELIYEIAMNSIDQFFSDTREYYNEEADLSVYVLFDPIITEFWRLCDEYEKRLQIKPEENKHRNDMNRALSSALDIPDYSYDARWYFDTKRRSGCRLVLLCYCEFCGYHYIPNALGEAYDAFVYHTQQIREALAELKQPNTAALPVTRRRRSRAA